MQVKLKIIPALNSLYELGIGEEQQETLRTKPFALFNSEEFQMHSGTLSGITFQLTTSKAMCHLEGRNFNNSTRTSDDLNFTLETYGAEIEDNDKNFFVVYNFKIKEIAPEDLTTVRSFGALSNFFRSLSVNFTDIVFENISNLWEELYTHIFINTEISGNYMELGVIDNSIVDLWPRASKLLSELNSKGTSTFVKEVNPEHLFYNGSPSKKFAAVIAVLESVNRRVVFTVEQSNKNSYSYNNSWNQYNNRVYISMLTPDHELYNYMDIGRILFRDGDAAGRVQTLVFTDDHPVLPTETILKSLWASASKAGELPMLLESRDIQQVVKKADKLKLREENEEVAKTNLSKKFTARLDKLDTKPISLNGMTISSTEITYENQRIFKPNEGWTKTLISELRWYWSDIQDLNFERILDRFVEDEAQSDASSGIIGEVSFNLDAQYTTNANGVVSKRLYINEHRVNASEVAECLQRALCFTSQEDYDYFLHSVSSCSLEIHGYLQNGVDVKAKDPLDGGMLSFKFPIRRQKNINYLVLNKQEFRVSDTQRLIRFKNYVNVLQIVSALLDGTIVQNVSSSDIKGLLDGAKREFNEAVEKSKKLLADTEKRFNIKIDAYNISGKTITGYLVKGKLDTYVVSADGSQVYRYPSGNYVCIVDKSTAQVGKDKLVNRLFALHNDNLVAQQITTL